MFAIAAVSTLATAGCMKPTPIVLRYLPDPAAHSAGRFFAAKVAVTTSQSPGVDARVGVIVDSGGAKTAILQVVDINGQTASVIAKALAESGLQPVMIGDVPASRQPPFGIDFMIMSGVNELKCDKRFLPGRVPGTYRLSASVVIKLELLNRDGVLAVVQGSSDLEEPPFGANQATYKPAITDPGKALSWALSRAVRSALADPALVAPLPQHKIPSPAEN
ncbi:MAG TPA: hypothetical protein VND20_05325 [Candidatus Binataceae bacterium]|nr:hypothetical protein [Candidatus Binataceae bacterium]